MHSHIYSVAAAFHQGGTKRHMVFPGYIFIPEVKCLGGFVS